MKKLSIMSMVFLVFFVSFAFAAEGDVATTSETTTEKVTFGTCVAEAAVLKDSCFAEVKDAKNACLANATDDAAKTECAKTYKAEKTQCKADFKASKVECKKIKHNVFESLGAGLGMGKAKAKEKMTGKLAEREDAKGQVLRAKPRIAQ
jgi:uncharacterized protein YgiB involved in biofilm formation